MVAAAGAGPWPQITRGASSPAAWMMIGASPPGPFMCGSATWRTMPAAKAASKALPPRSSTPMAGCEASQCVEATTPKVPRISGRVVKGGVSGAGSWAAVSFGDMRGSWQRGTRVDRNAVPRLRKDRNAARSGRFDSEQIGNIR